MYIYIDIYFDIVRFSLNLVKPFSPMKASWLLICSIFSITFLFPPHSHCSVVLVTDGLSVNKHVCWSSSEALAGLSLKTALPHGCAAKHMARRRTFTFPTLLPGLDLSASYESQVFMRKYFSRSFRTWRTGAAGHSQEVRGAACVWLTSAPALWAKADAALGRKSGEVLHMEGIIHDYSSINRRSGWKRICGLLCFVFTPLPLLSGWSSRYVSQLLCRIPSSACSPKLSVRGCCKGPPQNSGGTHGICACEMMCKQH